MMCCFTGAIISVPLGGLAVPASLCAGLGEHRSEPEPLLDAHLGAQDAPSKGAW